MDPMREVEIGQKVKESIAGDFLDPNDPWGHVQLEVIWRMCVSFDDAMRYEDIPVETRNRVRNIVLLGDPEGLRNVHREHMEALIQWAADYKMPELGDLMEMPK